MLLYPACNHVSHIANNDTFHTATLQVTGGFEPGFEMSWDTPNEQGTFVGVTFSLWPGLEFGSHLGSSSYQTG